ncbi:LexA family transcriptional regulator [Burkholderia cenocepacia]|uniref:LexA family transcriptional regulator n=1 Tax=Burkholderia cenocepacia TaxID=95486 RepID=UPI00285CD4F6|nr:LexA family transcriptional regulator [Burkholderia cenocepacia]MDR8077826.1 LexA family transcriptional regulator [Burkholderia cenocepacia]
MNSLADRLKEARADGDLSQEDLARMSGVSQSTIAHIESGRNKGSKHLLTLARALNVRPEWLELGREPKRSLKDSDGARPIVWETPDDLPPDDDRVWMDRYDYRFSAGTGHIQWEIRQKKALPFDIGFFRALGVKPQDCKLAQVHGRSMEPYLFNRDLMMICEAKTHVRDGRIYAIYFEDEPLVKQIFKEADGALRLHSYNTEYPDRIVAGSQLESLRIAGEVVYRSGSGPAGGN